MLIAEDSFIQPYIMEPETDTEPEENENNQKFAKYTTKYM